MNCKIKVVPHFVKEMKRLGKKYHSLKNDYTKLLEDLKQNPSVGVDLGNGLRKVRMAIASKGRGKSHGARVITFTIIFSVEEIVINLLTIYDKSERDNVSSNEIRDIMKEVGLL